MSDYVDKRFDIPDVVSSDASLSLSSSEDFKYNCCACKSRSGHSLEAVGCCAQCGEFLCQPCVKHHIENKVLKEHDVFNLHRISVVSDIDVGYGTPTKKFAADKENIFFLKDVNVKSEMDTEPCVIKGIAVLSEQLLAVADSKNKCVKIIDYKNDTVRDSLQLKGHPIAMTLLPHDQLAVTLKYVKCVHILATQPDLTVARTIRLDGYCLDVAYFNGKLLVSFEQPLRFQILDIAGQVIETVVPDPEVTSVCSNPECVAINWDLMTIFITDEENKICLGIDMNGKKIAECKQLEKPGGIVCSPKLAHIMICVDTHEVRKLTMDLQCKDILLNESDDLAFPCALCFSPEQQLLLVSSASVKLEDRNNIKLFKMC